MDSFSEFARTENKTMTASSTRASGVSKQLHSSMWEQHIKAFVARVKTDAAGHAEGPLAGRTVAVKDVIDVAGLPTRNGSAACADATPATADAPVVARLRDAGARIVGKTVTTEFAFTDPTPCRNPYALSRSPGGSSSGSGAAVGAGLVDIALGTQTAGSLIRPAAYCGAVGFKPGLGMLPMAGVTPLSPSYDMVGIIARNVGFAELAFNAMQDTCLAEPDHVCHAGQLALDMDTPVDPARQDALADAVMRISERLGPTPKLPGLTDVDRIVADHHTVMCAEAAKTHGHLLDGDRQHLLRPKFLEGLLAGRSTKPQARIAAAKRLIATRETFWSRHVGIDVILSLPVPDGPPLLGGSTGFQHWLTVWTVLGGPLLCLPWGVDEQGLPLSIMVAGRPGEDARLLRFGRELEATAPDMPPPPLPGR